MRQPLMLMPTGIPPAQAEALYDSLLEDAHTGRAPFTDASAWPGEDWDEDGAAAAVSAPTRSQTSPVTVGRLPTTGH